MHGINQIATVGNCMFRTGMIREIASFVAEESNFIFNHNAKKNEFEETTAINKTQTETQQPNSSCQNQPVMCWCVLVRSCTVIVVQ